MVYRVDPTREEDFELLCLLGADEGFEVFVSRRLPGAVALTRETVEIGRK